jgi:5-methylcytosine-specific restriction endonuclease McrA
MKNVQLRKSFRDKPCIVCSSVPSQACHIMTYATTLKDEENNLVNLCFKCHRLQHDLGIVTFAQRFPKYLEYVNELGFKIVEVFGVKKLRREI